MVLPAAAMDISGAGATFPAPVYEGWGEAAKAAVGVELNYQAIGSGEVDFGMIGSFWRPEHLFVIELSPHVSVDGVLSSKAKVEAMLANVGT